MGGPEAVQATMYFLIGFVIELYLKAILSNRGFTEKQLMKIGHRLSDALQEVEAFSALPDFDGLHRVIELMSPLHEKHAFRYLQPGTTIILPAIPSTLASLYALDRLVRAELDIPDDPPSD